MVISLSSLLARGGAPIAAMEAENAFKGLTEDQIPFEIGEKSLDPNAPMKISLVTDKMIEDAHLQPCTNRMHHAGGIPTDDGIFSEKIFGIDPEVRSRQFAYIDLGEKFFHPYIYEVLDKLIPRRFNRCASGQGSWVITSDGQLKELSKDDPNYDEYANGIPWLIKNFDKLRFEQSGSLVRSDRISLLKNFSKDEILISKWLVIPVIYRDVDMKSNTRKIPELDDFYCKLIQYSNSLRDDTFSFFNNTIRYNLQMVLVAIRKYGQTLLEKKHGFFHKAILGKSTDRGSRDVISVPSFRGIKKPSENPIDMFHSGIPLAKCLIIGYDFIMRSCLQFFEDNFRNATEYPIYDLKNGKYEIVGSIKIKNQVEKFNSDYIEKRINRFKNSHGTRFEVITLTAEDGTEIPFHMTGVLGKDARGVTNKETILNRPMTWTDLFYIAAVNSISDKYVYITRYPIEGYNSIFPTQCLPLSTIDTIPATVDGQFYPYYPKIDLKTPTDKISNLFNDTVTMSDLMIDIMGADFDGDTVSLKLCYTLEANQEAKEISESIRNFISQEGELIRDVGKEAFLTFYNMTRNEPVGKILSEEKKKELLSMKKDDITLDSLAKDFGCTTSSTKDKKDAFTIREPRFNLRDKVILQANEYINKKQIETTVGKILFNKLFVEDTEIVNLLPDGFYNVEVDAKKMKAFSKIVATGVMSGKIKLIPTATDFLKAWEFWGLGAVAIFAPSYSMKTINPIPKVEKMKEDLLEGIDKNLIGDLTAVEDKLVETAKEELQGDPGYFMFASGARGSFGNDYKNMALSIGAIENPITKGYDFMKSNYMQGIRKEDIPAAANSVVNGEYPKAIETAKGGYMTKQFFAVFQSIVLDDLGSDCGAKYGLPVTLTKDNLEDYVDQYIMDGNNLVLITNDLPSKYMNHEVMIRSPMYCLGKEKLCSKCAGLRYYKLGMTDAGMASFRLAGKLANASLKKRHSLKIETDHIDPNNLLI